MNSELSWVEVEDNCGFLLNFELADETSSPIEVEGEGIKVDDEISFIVGGFEGCWGLIGGGAAHTGITDLIWTAGAILWGLNPPVYMVLAMWAFVGTLSWAEPKGPVLIWLFSCWMVLSSIEEVTFPVLDIGNCLYIELAP